MRNIKRLSCKTKTITNFVLKTYKKINQNVYMFGKYPRRFPGLPGVPGVSPGSCYMKTNLFIYSYLENKNTIKKIQFLL